MFAKIFQSMYDGSLAQQGPWEALVTFQQFLILADRFGDVDIHPEVIARRTLVPLEILEKGIEVLANPDPFSRDPSEEGRRIVLISETRNWGWHIVNYTKYSAIRSAEERREYKRSYYLDNKPKDIDPASLSRFDEFWNAYPRKISKQLALRAWDNLKPTQEIFALMIEAIEEQKATEQWTKEGGKYIPHPTSWLNARRWEDEPIEKIDLGKCEYCERQAVAVFRGHPHCEVPRHRDHAEGKG